MEVSKPSWMWQLGTWASGGLGSAVGTVGLGGLRGLFQPKSQFHDFPFPIWAAELGVGRGVLEKEGLAGISRSIQLRQIIPNDSSHFLAKAS